MVIVVGVGGGRGRGGGGGEFFVHLCHLVGVVRGV